MAVQLIFLADVACVAAIISMFEFMCVTPKASNCRYYSVLQIDFRVAASAAFTDSPAMKIACTGTTIRG
jgi:hypothetical protein